MKNLKKNLLCQQLHQEKYFWPLHHYFLSHWFQSQIRFRHLLTQSLGFEPSHTEAAEQMKFCHVNLSIHFKFIFYLPPWLEDRSKVSGRGIRTAATHPTLKTLNLKRFFCKQTADDWFSFIACLLKHSSTESEND